jgi:hypothetical protein
VCCADACVEWIECAVGRGFFEADDSGFVQVGRSSRACERAIFGCESSRTYLTSLRRFSLSLVLLVL